MPTKSGTPRVTIILNTRSSTLAFRPAVQPQRLLSRLNLVKRYQDLFTLIKSCPLTFIIHTWPNCSLSLFIHWVFFFLFTQQYFQSTVYASCLHYLLNLTSLRSHPARKTIQLLNLPCCYQHYPPPPRRPPQS